MADEREKWPVIPGHWPLSAALTYHYLDKLIKVNDLDFENIKLNKSSYEDTFTYYSWFKVLYCVNPFHIILDKINIDLSEKYEEMWNKIINFIKLRKIIQMITMMNTSKSKLIPMMIYI